MLDGLCRGFQLGFSPSQKLPWKGGRFFADWLDISVWLFPGLLPQADVEVSSDAVGSIGYGAYVKGHRFAGFWARSQQLQSIAYKELFPIVLAAHVWGHFWVKNNVLFCSDNNMVVHILNTRASRVAACHSFFSSQHVS